MTVFGSRWDCKFLTLNFSEENATVTNISVMFVFNFEVTLKTFLLLVLIKFHNVSEASQGLTEPYIPQREPNRKNPQWDYV